MYPAREGVVVYEVDTFRPVLELFADECILIPRINQTRYAWMQVGDWLGKVNTQLAQARK